MADSLQSQVYALLKRNQSIFNSAELEESQANSLCD